MVKNLCVNLASAGRSADAINLTGTFATDELRSVVYQQMADKIYRRDNDPMAFIYLDSVYSMSKKIDYTNLALDFDFRAGQIQVLSEIGSQALNNQADEILKDITQDFKFDGIMARIDGIASEGNYYRALTAIPKTLTESQDLIARAVILREDSRAKEKLSKNINGQWVKLDRYLDWKSNYTNFIPN